MSYKPPSFPYLCRPLIANRFYSGSRFFSAFSSGPTFLRLYVTLYATSLLLSRLQIQKILDVLLVDPFDVPSGMQIDVCPGLVARPALWLPPSEPQSTTLASNCLSTSILAGLPGNQLFLVSRTSRRNRPGRSRGRICHRAAVCTAGRRRCRSSGPSRGADGNVLVGADVDLHAVTDRHVLGLGAADVGQIVVAVFGEEPDGAVGQGESPRFSIEESFFSLPWSSSSLTFLKR